MDVAFWYHFAILFEARLSLTAVRGKIRAARFMLQDLLSVVSPWLKRTGFAASEPALLRHCACWRGGISSIRAWSIRWAVLTPCGRCLAR